MIEELSEDEIERILFNYEYHRDGYDFKHTSDLKAALYILEKKGIFTIDRKNRFMKFTEEGLMYAELLLL